VRVTAVAEEGLEAAARRARYAALAELLGPGDFLLTAHQRDDQAETVLLQLMRGAGIAGLAAMPARAAFGPGELVRPLLGFARAALLAYAREHRLDWIEDPSNADLRLRRNFLRAEILPRLQQHWPEANAMLVRSAGHAAEAQALLDDLARMDLAGCMPADDPRYPYALSVTVFAALPAARQRNLLRYWLRQQGFLVPSARQLEEVQTLIRTAPRTRQACLRWSGAELWRYRERLVIVPWRPVPDRRLDVAWDLRAPLELPGIGRLRTVAVTGRGLVPERLGEQVRVRLRQGGEPVLLPGRRHHHALKKLLQAAGVPPWERIRLPVLYAGDQLAAVADRWVCAAFAAQPGESGLEIVWEPFAGVAAESEKIR
jgi:tRNA(Ile)-lysidine synthase